MLITNSNSANLTIDELAQLLGFKLEPVPTGIGDTIDKLLALAQQVLINAPAHD